MQLFSIQTKPSTVLRALVTARELLVARGDELIEPIDELIGLVTDYLDEEENRAGAVKDAKLVANILLQKGSDAARAALGVPPPRPEKIEELRNSGFEGDELSASKWNSVFIEVDEDAACGPGGTGYWVSAAIFLPVDVDTRDMEALARLQSNEDRES